MMTPQLTEPIDLFILLLRRWLTVAIFAVLGAGAGVGYAMLATPWYKATVTVVPSQRSVESGAAGIASLPLDALATDVQRIKAVLTSRSVRDAAIDRFALDAYYGTDRQRTRAQLERRCSASVDRLSGLVALTCEDPDPELAMNLATFFGEEGNRVFGRISVSSAREERKFLEGQVEKARRDVDEASRKLREFQRENKIIDLPEQSKAVISAMAALQGEMLSKQLELSYLSGFSSREESSVVQLRRQIRILKGQLGRLEALRPHPGDAARAAPPHADFFPTATSVPDLRFKLEELVREQKIQETLFFVMTQRYETAKVSEARDTSTFQILDQPALPTVPARPNKRSIVLLGLGGGLAVAFAWIILPLAWRNRLGRAASA